jgi:protein-tyrosine phosphatase
MISNKKTSVLFVCTGNICRSPTAEGVFRSMVKQAGQEGAIVCASAGTHGYHVGEPPDLRTQEAALRRGYDLSGQRGRKVEAADFNDFDLVLAMDKDNMSALARLRPKTARTSPVLFLDYVGNSKQGSRASSEVADPYYGGAQGFDMVLDVIEDGAAKLLAMLTGQA